MIFCWGLLNKILFFLKIKRYIKGWAQFENLGELVKNTIFDVSFYFKKK